MPSLPTLQKQMAKDIDDVFLNLENFEFSTTHKIEGMRNNKAMPAVECNLVVDHDTYTERNIKDKIEGINLSGFVFFVKKTEWQEKVGYIPIVNSALKFDGEMMIVTAVNDNIGVLEITLVSNKG